MYVTVHASRSSAARQYSAIPATNPSGSAWAVA
jgi:hypothetical protein